MKTVTLIEVDPIGQQKAHVIKKQVPIHEADKIAKEYLLESYGVGKLWSEEMQPNSEKERILKVWHTSEADFAVCYKVN